MGTGEELWLLGRLWDWEPGQRQAGVASPQPQSGAVRNSCCQGSFGLPEITGLFFPCYRICPTSSHFPSAAVVSGKAAHADSTTNPPEHHGDAPRRKGITSPEQTSLVP